MTTPITSPGLHHPETIDWLTATTGAQPTERAQSGQPETTPSPKEHE